MNLISIRGINLCTLQIYLIFNTPKSYYCHILCIDIELLIQSFNYRSRFGYRMSSFRTLFLGPSQRNRGSDSSSDGVNSSCPTGVSTSSQSFQLQYFFRLYLGCNRPTHQGNVTALQASKAMRHRYKFSPICQRHRSNNSYVTSIIYCPASS